MIRMAYIVLSSSCQLSSIPWTLKTHEKLRSNNVDHWIPNHRSRDDDVTDADWMSADRRRIATLGEAFRSGFHELFVFHCVLK